MTIEISILVAIVSVAAAIYFGLKSSRRDDTKDIEERAANNATINVKLDNIGKDVSDIKTEIVSTNNRVGDVEKKLVAIEASTKSAHHRIDRIEGKEGYENA